MNKRILYNRLAEPSTWAGLAGLALALGLSDEEWSTWSQALAGVFAVVSMLMREGGKDNENSEDIDKIRIENDLDKQ